MRLRRSSVAMADDPFTLVVAPDSHGAATGKLFLPKIPEDSPKIPEDYLFGLSRCRHR